MKEKATAATRGRALGALAGVLLLGTVGAWLFTRGGASDGATGGLQAFPPVRPVPGAGVSFEDFAGAAACRECHAEQFELWSGSTHGRAGGAPRPELLIAPFDGRSIRFRDAEVVPRRGGDGRYEFVVRQEGHAEVTFPVDGVVGGGHMLGGGTEGFVSRMPDGTVRFLPFDWSRQENAWFCNTGTRLDRGWIPVTAEMALADCGDWPPVRVLGAEARFANCQECHGSQIETRAVVGVGFETRWTTLAVNCESCHGPAARHAAMARAGTLGNSPDIGLPSRVVDSEDESLESCFRCHALKDVVSEGDFPGEPLTVGYALKFPILGDDPYLPDGRIRTFGYQASHLSSACYLDGSMSCVSCHEPHGQGYQDVNGRTLGSPFDDGQCTGCHASKLEDPEAHTFHAETSEGSRCVSCHMPYLQHPEVGPRVRFARSDHTIPIPRPAFDAGQGIESACRLCHPDSSPDELQARVDEWYGESKPHRPLVTALVAGEVDGPPGEWAPRLLRPELFDPMAQFTALSRLLVRLEPDARPDPVVLERLEALAGSTDLEVRAIAMAALHWSAGRDPAIRARLIDRLIADPAPDEPLRRRWAMALSFLGDAAVESGDTGRGLVAYEKALEVLPDEAALLHSVGLALNRAGRYAEALPWLRRSASRDPDAALPHVNIGVALAGLGDPAGAIRSYQEALRVNPGEALAWFNMGNVYLRAEDFERAVEAYRRAVDRDPGLALASFNLARSLIQLQRYPEALEPARRAVEFDPGNEGARRMLADLERVLPAGQE